MRHVNYTPHAHYETHYWLKAACLLRVPEEQFSGGVRPVRYGSRSAIRKSLRSFLQRNVPDFNVPAEDEALVFDGWTALCKHFAHPVFFEKSPQFPHHPAALTLIRKWMRTTDFQVRIIGLVRNPMSVLHSALQLFDAEPEKRQFGWAQAYRNILEFRDGLDEGQFHFMRYEDIVQQPASEFRRLCEFIGIDYETAVGQGVHSSSLNKWRDDPDFTLQLDASVREMAERLGYSVEDVFNPPKPEPGNFVRMRRGLKMKLIRGKSKTYNLLKRLSIQAGMSD